VDFLAISFSFPVSESSVERRPSDQESHPFRLSSSSALSNFSTFDFWLRRLKKGLARIEA